MSRVGEPRGDACGRSGPCREERSRPDKPSRETATSVHALGSSSSRLLYPADTQTTENKGLARGTFLGPSMGWKRDEKM